MPKFSVLVPTYNRADTIKYTLETILSQSFLDYEVVVANNGSNPDVSRVIANLSSPQIREVGGDVLSMSYNWERGLDACTGEYVIVVGDDDGLMPDALAYADRIFTATGSKLMMFGWHYYYWPQALAPWLRGRLLVEGIDKDRSIITYNSRAMLRQTAAFQSNPLFNPNIYSSFVHRSIIEKCKQRLGMYFSHQIPDWFSGLVNLYFTENLISFSKPLGMRGISHHSNGGGMMALSSGGKEVVDKFFSQSSGAPQTNFGEMENLYHPLSIMAEVFTHAKKVLMTDYDDVQFNYPVCVHMVANDVNRSHGGYKTLVAEAKSIARRYGVDVSSLTFPEEARSDILPVAPQGPRFDANGRCTQIVVDGTVCGITNVAEAVRLADAIVPP